MFQRPILCNTVNHSTPGLPVHHQVPEFTQTHVHRAGDAIPAILSPVIPFSCCPQSLPASGSFPESTLCVRWPKYWSFSFSISPSNEHSGLISFRMDWLDLLAVQGTLKSRLQHHSSKASILQRLAFFTVQLSHPYMTTGKTTALTRRTFVGKAVRRREAKSKGEKERYSHLNAEFQRIARRDKKVFLSDQCK